MSLFFAPNRLAISSDLALELSSRPKEHKEHREELRVRTAPVKPIRSVKVKGKCPGVNF